MLAGVLGELGLAVSIHAGEMPDWITGNLVVYHSTLKVLYTDISTECAAAGESPEHAPGARLDTARPIYRPGVRGADMIFLDEWFVLP